MPTYKIIFGTEGLQNHPPGYPYADVLGKYSNELNNIIPQLQLYDKELNTLNNQTHTYGLTLAESLFDVESE